MKKNFLVIGLGELGQTIAKTLYQEGADVIAVDESEELVEQIKNEVTVAVQLDATDKKALQQLGLQNIDSAVVCIGHQFDASILITAHLLEIGVKHVKVRAPNKTVESILYRLGAHEVFRIEHAMGTLIAHRMTVPSVTQEMEIGLSYKIVQWQAPETIVGKTLAELELPKKFKVQVIAIRAAANPREMQNPTATTQLSSKDQLFLSGHERNLRQLFNTWDSEKK